MTDMSTVLFADYDFPDIELERKLFADAGVELRTAQCKTEADVINAAAGCAGVVLQYAPITDRVLAALPLGPALPVPAPYPLDRLPLQ